MAEADQDAGEFGKAMGAVAKRLLGKPSSEKTGEIRFGTNGSMKIDLEAGTWFDNEAKEGGGTIDLVMREKSFDKPKAVEWLQNNGDIKPKESWTEYNYQDASGHLLFQVIRKVPKDFRQRRPDGKGGWIWKMAGVEMTIYRLPEILAAKTAGETIFIVEGEKSANALAAIGIAATCSPGGAGKWFAKYSRHLAGANVVILPDNDDAGRDHAASVAHHLQGHCQRIAILALPGLAPKADAYNWLQAGGSADQLRALADGAPQFDPEATPKPKATAKAKRPNVDPADLAGFDLTEDGIALAFTARHRDQLRFDHHRNAWYKWDAAIWRLDEVKLAFSWARAICRELAKQAPADDKPPVTLAKAATAAAVERFAQADQEMAVTSAIWDNDPWLLGTPGGTVDLRTGQTRAADRADHITKQTAVAPSEKGDCPLWLRFLGEATQGDAELIRFLQQWAGYTLTGDTREHALVFVYGPGGNGKSVFLNLLIWIMGQYAQMSAMETFTAGSGDKHPTDLAMLRGARMVAASETEEGRAWAETRIKQLTGGDPVTARFMKQDFFTFTPAFKLAVIGNHKPVLRNVDEAARRRFNIIPFVHKPATPDRDLERKLRAEAPAILRWMINGCLDWQANGLVRPAVVKAATEEYFSEQDSVKGWIEDQCEVGGRSISDTTAALFASWTAYALAAGEKPGTQKWFSQNLDRQGFEPVRETPGHRGKRGFLKIRVRSVDTSKQWQNRAEAEADARYENAAGYYEN